MHNAPERAVDGQGLYEITAENWVEFLGRRMPAWDDLPWRDRDRWEATADELNEARRGSL